MQRHELDATGGARAALYAMTADSFRKSEGGAPGLRLQLAGWAKCASERKSIGSAFDRPAALSSGTTALCGSRSRGGTDGRHRSSEMDVSRELDSVPSTVMLAHAALSGSIEAA